MQFMEQKNVEKISRENIGKHLLEYQLNLINKTSDSILLDDMWKFNWVITKKQYKEFKLYAIPLLKKTFRCNVLKANGIFEWFFKEFGLRIIN